jgi:hypothetical protein
MVVMVVMVFMIGVVIVATMGVVMMVTVGVVMVATVMTVECCCGDSYCGDDSGSGGGVR